MRGRHPPRLILGWENTNVDYFEIVDRSGLAAKIRPVGTEFVPNSGYSPLAGHVVPCPGRYIGELMRKLIGLYEISMSLGG